MTSGREIYIEKSFPGAAVLSAREGKKNQKDLKMSSVFHRLLFNGFIPAEFAIAATDGMEKLFIDMAIIFLSQFIEWVAINQLQLFFFVENTLEEMKSKIFNKRVGGCDDWFLCSRRQDIADLGKIQPIVLG